jgi:hypothetical protein
LVIVMGARALFYAIAVSFNLYQRSVMNAAIDHGGSEGVVIVQDRSPVSERAVGGDDDGPTFIPVRDDRKQEFGALLVHGEEA